MFLKVLLIFYSFSHYAECFTNLDQLYGNVIYANIMFRHGHSVPVDTYLTDPYRDPSFWPEARGELTNYGKLEHYNLGKWLRSRYDHLIQEVRAHEAIYVQSSAINRSMMSAECNLAGMFPPSPEDTWGPINWQPIPVNTSNQQVILGRPCARYIDAIKEVNTLAEVQLEMKCYEPLFEYITFYTNGWNFDNFINIFAFGSMVLSEVSFNLTLPAWLSKVYPDELREPIAYSSSLGTYTDEMKRLSSGLLVKEIIENFDDKLHSNLLRNISMYSAHDMVLANFLNTLGVFNGLIPIFASTVLLELRENCDNKQFVTLLYKNTTSDPYLLTIPGCDEACPLDTFKSLLTNFIPEDWEAECNN